VAVERSDGRANVRVSDTGPGVPPDLAERIFDRFYSRVPPEGRATGGVGLGLAIARKIAEDHRGSLSASVALGGGSVFTAALPLAAPHRTRTEALVPSHRPEIASPTASEGR
jgi:two-component system OmpR family sensor kinase